MSASKWMPRFPSIFKNRGGIRVFLRRNPFWRECCLANWANPWKNLRRDPRDWCLNHRRHIPCRHWWQFLRFHRIRGEWNHLRRFRFSFFLRGHSSVVGSRTSVLEVWTNFLVTGFAENVSTFLTIAPSSSPFMATLTINGPSYCNEFNKDAFMISHATSFSSFSKYQQVAQTWIPLLFFTSLWGAKSNRTSLSQVRGR